MEIFWLKSMRGREIDDSPIQSAAELRVEISAKEAAELIVREFPELQIETIKKLGGGLDNLAFEVNGEYIFRFPKRDEDNQKLLREGKVLELVKDLSSVPVPEPTFKSTKFMGYRKIEGVSLLEGRETFDGYEELAETLAKFLSQTHSLSLEEARRIGVPENSQSFSEWLADAPQFFEQAKTRVPVELHAPIEKFLREESLDGNWQPFFSHNDLGIEHIIVKDNSVTGIIDWADAEITDPAYDFGKLLRDLGEDLVKEILARYTVEANNKEEIFRRAVFYAKCSALEDLAYTAGDGKDKLYWDNSRAALKRLFRSE
nr:Phosphotransferase enzyme family [uncultured bacterium]